MASPGPETTTVERNMPHGLGSITLASPSWQERSEGLDLATSGSTHSLQLGTEAAAVAAATSQWLQGQDGDLDPKARHKPGPARMTSSPRAVSPGASPRARGRASIGWTKDDTAWLTSVRRDVDKSVEWQALTRQMYLQVQRAMEKSKVLYYGDLSADERALMLDDIEDSLSEGPIFRNFERLLAERLEGEILQRLEERPASLAAQSSRPEAIVELAAHGVGEMLASMPGKVPAMRMLLNRQLPTALRIQVWDVYLQDAEALQAFRNRVSVRRIATIASTDTDVTERCQGIFETEFPEIVDSSTLIMLGKTVLSYRAAAFGRVDDAHFYWVIPILVVFASSYNDLPRVVEAMHALVALPKLEISARDVVSTQTSLRRVKHANELASALQARDAALYTHLLDVMKSELEVEAASDPTAASQSPTSRLLDLVSRGIERLFVGMLHIEVCLYVWDQCLILGFDRLAVPVACSVLLLLRDQLLEKSSFASLNQVVAHQAKGITTRQLARIMESAFFEEIRAEVGTKAVGNSHWKNEPLERLGSRASEELLAKEAPETEAASAPDGLSRAPHQSAEDVKARLEARAVKSLEAEAKASGRSAESPSALNASSSAGETSAKSEGADADQEVKDDKDRAANGMVVLPMVNLRVNAFADALKRARELNPNKEEDALRSELVAKVPEFAEQDPSAPVLRSKVGKAICFFRALKPDESADLAKEIVTCELERVEEDAPDDRVAKLVKHLIHFSKAKAGFRKGLGSSTSDSGSSTAPIVDDGGPAPTPRGEVETLEAIVRQMAGAIRALQSGRFASS